jgi:hypothetical protein
MKRIIYQSDDGGCVVVQPAPNCGLTLEQIALKDVPPGVAYKIIDEADLPQDRTFRNAWEADTTNPDGHGADYGVGATDDKSVIDWNEDGTPILRGEG